MWRWPPKGEKLNKKIKRLYEQEIQEVKEEVYIYHDKFNFNAIIVKQ